MNKTIEKILSEQEKLNAAERHATINHETGQFIHALIKIKNPKHVLEVGTSIGYSAIWIASALEKGSKLTCIDGWKERAAIAKKFFKRSKLPITLVEGNALEVIPTLKTKFDVMFIDATKAEYLKYLTLATLNKNALIIADNVISHESKMKDFLVFARKHNASILTIGSGLAIFVL